MLLLNQFGSHQIYRQRSEASQDTVMFPLCQTALLEYSQLFRPIRLLTELEGLAGQVVPAEADSIFPTVTSMLSLIVQEDSPDPTLR